MPWLVKDYADGWITFQRGEDALREVEQMGEALVRFVPAHTEGAGPWLCPVCGGNDDDRQLMCEACGGVGLLGEAEPMTDAAIAKAEA